MRRTHDAFYKKKKGTVKQAFKQIADLIEGHGGSGLNIADIGCAAGVAKLSAFKVSTSHHKGTGIPKGFSR